MNLIIQPSEINGRIGVPGSKSHTIRGVICGIMAEGKSILKYPLESDDTKAAINAAKAFGKFQCILADYPIDSLSETIPNFHNTVSRFADFKKAVADNLSGRASQAEEEIKFVLDREKDCAILLDMLNAGELPLTPPTTSINFSGTSIALPKLARSLRAYSLSASNTFSFTQ